MPERIGPGYKDATVQVRSTRLFILHASATKTASFNGNSQVVGDYAEGILDIDITAVTGTTPKAVFELQTKVNGKWRTIPGVTIPEQTAVGSVTIEVTNFGEEIRLVGTLSGTTPSFTFTSSFLAKT